MTTKTELACVYSALILVDDDIAVTVRNFTCLVLLLPIRLMYLYRYIQQSKFSFIFCFVLSL